MSHNFNPKYGCECIRILHACCDMSSVDQEGVDFLFFFFGGGGGG